MRGGASKLLKAPGGVGSRLKHSLSGDNYQFLHKSVIPSYHFQKSLRRLPIPKLPDTVNRYLASAKAVLNPEQYAQAEKLIRDFEKTSGPVLQNGLISYDKAHRESSYISEPWFDLYLRARVPVPVHYNPFMVYAPDPNAKFMKQLTRATNLVISYGRFKKSLDAEVLAPEVFHLNPAKSDTNTFRTVCKNLPPSLSWFGAVAFKAFPLDMSQYKSLFNGSRIPRKEKDSLHNDPSKKFFLAMRRGRFYAVRLFDDKGDLVPAESVHASLAWVLAQPAPSDGVASAVGSLTTLDRDSWAGAREALLADGNGAALNDVDGALFALCLDDLATDDPKRLVQSLLIGDDAANRWFDKCFQVIVDGNGQATLNFEHSWGDGVAVLRLMEESFKDSNTHHFVGPDETPGATGEGDVREIKFKVSDALKNAIAGAQKKHVASNSDLDFATLEYKGMTRDTIKKHKLSPDSIMQLAIQMAYHTMYNDFAPTYESCSTAAFLKGRTECMRSATQATRDATLAIASGKTPAEVRPMISECANVHSQLVKEASMGQGFDRHLLGLRITAEREGKEAHELFSSDAHAHMGQFVLSTSTLSTETLVFGGFGPVVPDGFGIGYNVVPSMLGAVITSYASKRKAGDFGAALHKSLDQLKVILEATTPKKE